MEQTGGDDEAAPLSVSYGVAKAARDGRGMKIRLPADATLGSIVGKLKDPEEFVRAVFANMRGGRSDMSMRVALDSNPARPDYCIEMYFEERNSAGEWKVIGCSTIAELSGRTHRELPYIENGPARLWSNAAMSWQEVQALLGELRGIAIGSKRSGP